MKVTPPEGGKFIYYNRSINGNVNGVYKDTKSGLSEAKTRPVLFDTPYIQG
jgi:hypothetical protein